MASILEYLFYCKVPYLYSPWNYTEINKLKVNTIITNE